MNKLKKQILIKTLFIFLITYLIIIFPPTLWKVYAYDTSFFKLILNPFPIDQAGLDNFYRYLVNAGRGNDIILGIIFPNSIGTLTNSLGLGVFVYFILFRDVKLNFIPIILITTFIILGYLKRTTFFKVFSRTLGVVINNFIKKQIRNKNTKSFQYFIIYSIYCYLACNNIRGLKFVSS